MNSYKHLKPRQYYVDLHDKITVDSLRRSEEYFIKDKEGPTSLCYNVLWGLVEYFKKGERYLTKSDDILKWMDRDRKRDEKVQSAELLEVISCLNCKREMECESIDLQTHLSNEPLLFIYHCNNCGRGRAFYDNGEEYRTEVELCPKCHAEMNENRKREGDVIIITSVCPNCQHEEMYKLDLNIKKEIDPNFEIDRDRFCMTEEEGQEYFSGKESMSHIADLVKRWENKEIYEKISKIKCLPIGEIKRLMTEAIEKEGYTDLKFEKPDMGKFVSVEFTAQDNKADREKYDSRIQLKRIINKTLVDTNWRLMSDGIYYRLGFVSGRIRGYEGEEELTKLIN